MPILNDMEHFIKNLENFPIDSKLFENIFRKYQVKIKRFGKNDSKRLAEGIFFGLPGAVTFKFGENNYEFLFIFEENTQITVDLDSCVERFGNFEKIISKRGGVSYAFIIGKLKFIVCSEDTQSRSILFSSLIFAEQR